MSVLKKIRTKLDDMTPTDRQIGQYIIDNPDKMLGLSSAALAVETGRSQSSVVKFSQRIGCATYQALKIAVSEAKSQGWETPAGMIHGTIERDDSYRSILEKLIASKLVSIQQTVAINAEADIQNAVECLHQAGRIQLAAVGASSLVARDFSYKLTKLGRNVLHNNDSHIQIANASALGPDDVLFALSHSGLSLETLRIAELAVERGAKVISVTGLQDNPLSMAASICLYTVTDEERVRSSSITARDAQLTLIDLLFIMLMQCQSDARSYVEKSEKAVSVLKVKSRKR